MRAPEVAVTAVPAITVVDLNADAGESFGRYTLGDDGALMQAVTSVSVACGWHAGDPGVIRHAIAQARAAGVSVGAHPSYPDLQGFGRREMTMASADLTNGVIYQVAAVAGLAAAEGVALRHVKPHGALYNVACRDVAVARAVVQGVVAVDRRLAVFAPPGSHLAKAAEAAGLDVVTEGFTDRAYEPDGQLVDRARPNAVLHHAVQVADRAAAWMQSGMVPAVDGTLLPLRVRSLCVHGDTDGAAAICMAIRRSLDAAGVRVQAPGA